MVKMMKRFTKKILVLTITVAMLGFSLAYAAEDIVNFTGKLVRVTGDVQIKRAGQLMWETAEHGMEISAKDEIKTGIESSTDIVFSRNGKRSKVRILDEANMSLLTLDLDKVTGDSEILLDLAIGHIIIKTDPLSGKSKFEVVTPTAMTAVRGTGFEVKVVKDEGPVANAEAVQ